MSASGWLLITWGQPGALRPPPPPRLQGPWLHHQGISKHSTEIGLAAQSPHLLRGGGREDLWSDSGASCGQMGKPRRKEGMIGLRSHGTLGRSRPGPQVYRHRVQCSWHHVQGKSLLCPGCPPAWARLRVRSPRLQASILLASSGHTYPLLHPQWLNPSILSSYIEGHLLREPSPECTLPTTLRLWLFVWYFFSLLPSSPF